MKPFQSFLFILLISGSFSLAAQVNNIDESLKVMELMRGSEITAQNANVQQQLQQRGSTVFINQIGEGNMVNAQLRATNTANSTFHQNGDFNSINSSISARNIENTIIQNGTNNRILDYANSPNQDVSLNLNQQGNDLNFERFGSNSIGDQIQFNMTGSFKTIIVRNFK